MYLNNVLLHTPELLETMVNSHQKGLIPPNSWVIDLDTIVENAKVLSAKAKSLGLFTYLMSKQHNRNPYINKLALANGLNKMVTVDVQGAISMERYNVPLGHAGHLNQIPRHLVSKVLRQNPDIITIYNIEHAKWINDAAKEQNVHQDLMVRVYDEGDLCFDGQEGGLTLKQIPELVTGIKELSNVTIAGVTAFPCIIYNESAEQNIIPTNNMNTVLKAAEMLRDLGFDIKQINAPGNTSSSEMELLKENGATHVEPGNALIGTAPNNAFFNNVPEKTAFGYVTEVSHIYNGTAFCYGGGVYHTNYSDRMFGLVGSTWEEAKNNKVEYDFDIVQDIDYHMQLKPTSSQHCKVGDSAVFAYRTQMHMTRSYIVPVSGISGKRDLKVHYIFDNANNAMDQDYKHVDPVIVCKDIDKLIESY